MRISEILSILCYCTVVIVPSMADLPLGGDGNNWLPYIELMLIVAGAVLAALQQSEKNVGIVLIRAEDISEEELEELEKMISERKMQLDLISKK